MTTRESIINHVKAGYSGLMIISHEQQRVEAEIASIARAVNFQLHVWSITKGVCHMREGQDPIIADGTDDPLAALTHFEQKLDEKSILLLKDFHFFTGDVNPLLVCRLKECLLAGKDSNKVLIILGCQLKLLPELEKEFTVVEFKLPDRKQLLTIAETIVENANKVRPKDKPPITLNGHTDSLLDAASGLTCAEAENAFALAIVETKDITPGVVAREKAATLKKGGLLEVLDTNIGLDDIGGLEELKDWISKRRNAFSADAKVYGLPLPRGFMMVGIPGCSKTLTAKAVAKILGVPLLKLDGGKLFGSLVGQSEANIRSVIQACEAMAPVVVLCDEIEKSFSGSKSSGSTDGGTSARVLGTFLQWMNDKTAPVFVVATANSISDLPPEFLRKGRFDEIFFNDLPTEDERQDIWRIQITKHGRKPKGFDLKALAKATPEWTGAEIEALFRESLFAAFDKGKEPTTELLIELSKETAPLSKTMATQVQGIREWAKGKARRSSKAVAVTQSAGRKIAD